MAVSNNGDEGTDLLTGFEQINFTAADGTFGGVYSVLTGTAGNDNLSATPYWSLMFGAEGNDTITGGAGNDTLHGGTGNDTLNGGAGNDTLQGGGHYDTVVYAGYYMEFGVSFLANGDVQVIDRNTANGNEGTDLLNGVEQITFNGGGIYGIVTGTIGNDSLNARPYCSLMFGHDGNDTLVGGTFDDTLLGGTGNDNLNGASGSDQLFGGTGWDILSGSDGNDSLYGEGHNDTLDGGIGNDALYGGDDDDTLDGGDGNDTLYGEKGSNKLYGGNGNDFLRDMEDGRGDWLYGGEGNDTIFAETGYDSLYGGNGDDLLTSTTYYRIVAAPFFMYGEGGNDHVSGNGGKDSLSGGEGNDKILGLTDNDSLYGDDGNDILDGMDGDDKLYGGNGDDTLNGEDSLIDNVYGNDTLDGGVGKDQLVGGAGSDIYYGGDGDDALGATALLNNATKQLYGGNGSDVFALGVKGNISLGLDFNTQKLGDFVNAITLPSGSFKGEKLAASLILGGAKELGSFLGTPITKFAFGWLISAITAGVNAGIDYGLEQQKIENQRLAAKKAVAEYDKTVWGEIFESGARDLIVVQDFQIGVDHIVLPSLESTNYSYQIDNNVWQGQGGVMLSIRRNTGTDPLQSIAFIKNNYQSVGMTDFQFAAVIQDLISGGSVIQTFSQTPIYGVNNVGVTEIVQGTFANDNIISDTTSVGGGDDQVFGKFGHDVIQGGSGNDTLFGGFNSNDRLYGGTIGSAPATWYENDGDDILSGGDGNDQLFGENGDDFLTGGNGNDIITGGAGADGFVFNALGEGIDLIKDFMYSSGDKIHIKGSTFGATSTSQFSFDAITKALSFGGQQFATLENVTAFDTARDIAIV